MKAPPNLDLKNRRQGRMSSTEIAEVVEHTKIFSHIRTWLDCFLWTTPKCSISIEFGQPHQHFKFQCDIHHCVV